MILGITSKANVRDNSIKEKNGGRNPNYAVMEVTVGMFRTLVLT